MKCHYKPIKVLKLNILGTPSIDQDVKEMSKETNICLHKPKYLICNILYML